MNIQKKLRKVLCVALCLFSMTASYVPHTTVPVHAATTSTNSTTLTLTEGSTSILRLSGVTSGITWKSSNKKVVSVSKAGKIKAKKPGTASVIATYKGKKYKWIVNVKANDMTSVSSALKSGDTSTLTGTNLKVADKILSIIDEIITDDMSAYDKVKAVHDYIILNCKYDTRASYGISALPKESFHPEGCILKGTCVCQGYAETFQLFMDALDISCKTITGTADNGTGSDSHAWNCVKIGSRWYNIDLTFDDPVPDTDGLVRYTYFLRNDEFFNRSHIATAGNPPECNSTTYLMKPYKEYIVSSTEEAEESFLKQRDEGKKYFTFVYKPDQSIDFDFLFNYSGASKGYSSFQKEKRSSYIVFITFFK